MRGMQPNRWLAFGIISLNWRWHVSKRRLCNLPASSWNRTSTIRCQNWTLEPRQPTLPQIENNVCQCLLKWFMRTLWVRSSTMKYSSITFSRTYVHTYPSSMRLLSSTHTPWQRESEVKCSKGEYIRNWVLNSKTISTYVITTESTTILSMITTLSSI